MPSNKISLRRLLELRDNHGMGSNGKDYDMEALNSLIYEKMHKSGTITANQIQKDYEAYLERQGEYDE